MKLLKFSLFGFIAASLFLASCGQAPKTAETGEVKTVDEKKVSSGTSLTLDTKISKVTWDAAKGVGKIPVGKHNGTFELKSGTISLKDGKILGGKFEIDVATLKVLDIPAKDEGNGKLAGHLKSKDFFEVDKFPTATFEIVSVEATKADSANVTGNLTLKGKSKSVTFPAKLEVQEDRVRAEANFYINRKDWELSYNSDESMGDKFIRPEVGIGFKIVAKK